MAGRQARREVSCAGPGSLSVVRGAGVLLPFGEHGDEFGGARHGVAFHLGHYGGRVTAEEDRVDRVRDRNSGTAASRGRSDAVVGDALGTDRDDHAGVVTVSCQGRPSYLRESSSISSGPSSRLMMTGPRTTA